MSKKNPDELDEAAGGVTSRSRDASADAAKAKENQKLGGTDKPLGAAAEPEGERITQNKPSLGEALSGAPGSMEAVGQGSVTESAPAVHAQEAPAPSEGRVVQQGDDCMVWTRNPINTQLLNPAKVHSVNEDGTINVRIPQNNGAPPIDVSSVSVTNLGDGSPYFTLLPK